MNLGDDPKQWPAHLRELWEERAAILEYDGGLSRDEAERQARELIQHDRARNSR
jgi:hypothetical protein